MVALRRKQEPPSHPFAGCYRQYSADSSATAAICIMGYREMDRDNDDSSMMDPAADVDGSIDRAYFDVPLFDPPFDYFSLAGGEIFGGLKANDWSTLGDHRFRRTSLQLCTVY